MRKRCEEPLNRSLRRRVSTKGPASACQWCTASQSSRADASFSTVAKAAPATLVPSLTILAVDDDALVLMNTVAMLEDLGHTAFEAYSAKEALEILRRDAELLLGDVNDAPLLGGLGNFDVGLR